MASEAKASTVRAFRVAYSGGADWARNVKGSSAGEVVHPLKVPFVYKHTARGVQEQRVAADTSLKVAQSNCALLEKG